MRSSAGRRWSSRDTASSGEERVPAVVLDAVQLHVAGLQPSDRPGIFASFGASLDLTHLASRHRGSQRSPAEAELVPLDVADDHVAVSPCRRPRGTTPPRPRSRPARRGARSRRRASRARRPCTRRGPGSSPASRRAPGRTRGRGRPASATKSAGPVGRDDHASPSERLVPEPRHAARITAIHGDARHLHGRIVARPDASSVRACSAPSTTTRSIRRPIRSRSRHRATATTTTATSSTATRPTARCSSARRWACTRTAASSTRRSASSAMDGRCPCTRRAVAPRIAVAPRSARSDRGASSRCAALRLRRRCRRARHPCRRHVPRPHRRGRGAPLPQRRGTRVVMDYTRLDAVGHRGTGGSRSTASASRSIAPSTWGSPRPLVGHPWRRRARPERRPGPAPQFFWLWAPVQLRRRVHALRRERERRRAAVAPQRLRDPVLGDPTPTPCSTRRPARVGRADGERRLQDRVGARHAPRRARRRSR